MRERRADHDLVDGRDTGDSDIHHDAADDADNLDHNEPSDNDQPSDHDIDAVGLRLHRDGSERRSGAGHV